MNRKVKAVLVAFFVLSLVNYSVVSAESNFTFNHRDVDGSAVDFVRRPCWWWSGLESGVSTEKGIIEYKTNHAGDGEIEVTTANVKSGTYAQNHTGTQQGGGLKVRSVKDISPYSQVDTKAIPEGMVSFEFNIQDWGTPDDYYLQLIDLISYTLQNDYVWLGAVRLKSNVPQKIVLEYHTGDSPDVIETFFNVDNVRDGNWHRMDVYWRVDGTNGTVAVEVDGSPAISKTGYNNTFYDTGTEERLIYGLARVLVGITLTSTYGNWWEVLVDDWYIYNSLDITPERNWMLYNGTQWLADYHEGNYTLLDDTYTVKNYYHDVLLNQTSIDTATYGNTTVDIDMQMKALTLVSDGYIALNKTGTLTLVTEVSGNVTFTFSDSGPGTILVDVTENASYIQRNNVNQTGWTYISSSTPKHIILETSTSDGTWEVITGETPPPPPPPNIWQMTFDHRDRENNVVDTAVTWALWNDTQELTYAEGSYTLLDGTYTLNTFYKTYLLNTSSLSTATYGNTTVTVNLEMKEQNWWYLVANKTFTTFTVNEQSSVKFRYTVTGSGVYTMIIDVLSKPAYVSKDSVNQTEGTILTYSNNLVIVESPLSIWELGWPTGQPEPSLSIYTQILISALSSILSVSLLTGSVTLILTKIAPPENPELSQELDRYSNIIMGLCLLSAMLCTLGLLAYI